MKKIHSFFKRQEFEVDIPQCSDILTSDGARYLSETVSPPDYPQTKNPRIEKDLDVERDPILRKMICDYPVDQRNVIIIKYLRNGPYQPRPLVHDAENSRRRFVLSWYKQFEGWLEYSNTSCTTFCLYCFLFAEPSVFTVGGFKNWKKVNNGKDCAFLSHTGTIQNSSRKLDVAVRLDLLNKNQDIRNVIDRQTVVSKADAKLRLRTSIDIVELCALQGMAFRGHDETDESMNPENLRAILKHTAKYNDKVARVWKNAPKNATYTSPNIQKEILLAYPNKIRRFIREEIVDHKFCIIVDESRDESNREQMTIILRFVDKFGLIQERFFDLCHVVNTKSITLHRKICGVLVTQNLSLSDIRGQGYDGASKMRGKWNGLQALFLKDCPYAYYIHYFAHRLQSILVVALKSVIVAGDFFNHLSLIINIVTSSAKRHDELQIAQAIQIEDLISADELQTGKGKNQLGTLQRPCDTRWSSHYTSLHSLLRLFDPTLSVLYRVVNDKIALHRATANVLHDMMRSFQFVFVLHFMIELLGRTNDLCKMLQGKSIDIINAMDTVSITKEALQKYRGSGWNDLLEMVKVFCVKQDIDIPDISSRCRSVSSARARNNPITWEHHYQIDIFNETIDCILQEMTDRFNEHTFELIRLSAASDPKDEYKLFDIGVICKLVEKFYPADFTAQEQFHLKYQLELFEIDIRKSRVLQNLSTLSELCKVLADTEKRFNYSLIDGLIRFILTLPVSTSTSERAFSAMKIVKTRLQSKMEDQFLSSSLLVNIEREIVQSLDVDYIIDKFVNMGPRRSQFS